MFCGTFILHFLLLPLSVSDVVKVFVTEGDDVILPCAPNPKVNIEGTVFDWKKDDKEVFLFSDGGYYGNGLSGQDKDFKGRVSHFVEELKHGNASILIKNTKTTDSGSYSCFFPHLKPSQIFRIELVVGEYVHNTAKGAMCTFLLHTQHLH